VPRLWTPPLRDLTPDTSVGFAQVDFATRVLRRPPDPWQAWLWIHAGELLPDGSPRFREVIALAARQNGKTETPSILSCWWLGCDHPGMIVGTSTKLEYAAETWDKTRKLITATKALDHLHDTGRSWWVRGAGLTEMRFLEQEGDPLGIDRRYRIAAANEEGGRSLTIRRLVMDELRQHKDWSAYDAAENATAAVWDAQTWMLSNAGSDASVVLNSKRAEALAFIERGEGNGDVGLFEHSAPEDADPEDPEALAMANPNMGRRLSAERLLSKARAAVAAGGEQLTGFQTESMCIRVRVLNPAIDPGAWLRCRVPGTLDEVRGRLAACLDVAPDGGHVTLAVAGMLGAHVRLEIVGGWSSLAQARIQLPSILGRIRPKTLGWFPSGPGAQLAADLKERHGADRFPPPGVTLAPITGDMATACMGMEEQVRSRALLHSGDPLLDQHVGTCERMARGGRWVFVSSDGSHIDAAYAGAGAVHLARTMPAGVGKPRLVVAD
jgi:hypothetical protein